MHIGNLLVCGVAVAGLAACSTVNDGSTEVRYWQNGQFTLLRPDSDQRLDSADNFSITLQKAFIDRFQEWPVSRNAILTGRDGLAKHGEIAVLVKTTESGSPKETRPTDPTREFDGHRLIYYSDDVYQNQYLNFEMAVPLWGPAKVPSGALKLEFVVLEMDRTSEQAEQLLTTLADIGKSQAALGGPLGGALLSLGQTLVTSANDDRQMRFPIVFDLDNGPMALRTGRYVLVRQENRQIPVNWSKICVNENDGLLYWRDGEEKRFTEDDSVVGPAKAACGSRLFREGSYLSLIVSPRTSTTQFAVETYKDLTDQLAGETNPTLSKVKDIVGGYAISAAERQNHGLLLTQWREVELATAGLADASASRADQDSACAVDPTSARVKSAETLLAIRVQKLFSDMARMKAYVSPPGGTAAGDLKVKDAITASDFESVARTALLYVSDSNVPVSSSLDIKTVGANAAGGDHTKTPPPALFDSQSVLLGRLKVKANQAAALAAKQGTCRIAT
jgi:hypothetical protein